MATESMLGPVFTPTLRNGENNMNESIRSVAPLIGRILLVVIFLWSGFNKITGFAGSAGYMASKGLPMVEVLLVLSIVIEIGGALMIIFGWKARVAAAVLFLWMIPVTLVFHNFWAVPPDQVQMQMINFFKNLSMMGGLLLVLGLGSGRYSVDRA